MQTVMRAIVARGDDQASRPTTDGNGVGVTHTRRQLVVHEDVMIGGGGGAQHLEQALHESEARNDERLHQLAVYTNQAAATTEQRLEARLQEALNASHAHLEATTTAHTERHLTGIEAQFQQALHETQERILAATQAAIQERAASMETQISAGLARAETDVRDYALHHAHECETRLQEALKQSEMQFETAAKVHAELQSTHIEGRLRATREADIQQYMLACDTNIQNALDEARSDMEARASVYAEVQCESVEERLQQKLNRALRAAEEESHTYVDTRATEITTKFERALYDAKTEIDTACEIRAASTEARLQKMLWEAQDGTQAKLSDMEVLLRDGVHHTKPNQCDLKARVSCMEAEVNQRFMEAKSSTDIQLNQFVSSVDRKIDDKLRNVADRVQNHAAPTPATVTSAQTTSRASSTDTVAPESDTGSGLTSPKGVGWSATWSKTGNESEILTALRRIGASISHLHDSTRFATTTGDPSTLEQPTPIRRAKSASSKQPSSLGKTTGSSATQPPSLGTASATSKTASSSKVPRSGTTSSDLDRARAEAAKGVRSRAVERTMDLRRSARIRQQRARK